MHTCIPHARIPTTRMSYGCLKIMFMYVCMYVCMYIYIYIYIYIFIYMRRPISIADVLEPASGVRNLTWRHPTVCPYKAYPCVPCCCSACIARRWFRACTIYAHLGMHLLLATLGKFHKIIHSHAPLHIVLAFSTKQTSQRPCPHCSIPRASMRASK
jgi:hypothetical protein